MIEPAAALERPSVQGTSMAHILPFRSGAARAALEPEPPQQAASAQIIIFPGVRRERHAEPDPRQNDMSRPQRDILQLPD
jgi:hypothetical protein